MKSKIKLFLSVVISLPLLSVGVVAAQTGDQGTSGPSTGPGPSTSNNGSAGSSTPTANNAQNTQTQSSTTQATSTQLKERVAKRKAEFKATMTTAQQKRMQGRCKNAQTVLTKTVDRAKVVQTNRDKIHNNLLEKLTTLEAKLKSAGADTTQLATQITDLKTKIDTFKTDTDAYLLAVQDTATLDCQADPVAFKASLEASRALLKKVHGDAVAIRNSLAQSIRPLLVELKQSLTTEEAN